VQYFNSACRLELAIYRTFSGAAVPKILDSLRRLSNIFGRTNSLDNFVIVLSDVVAA